MNLLEGLNAPQRAAVTHAAGPLLIFAGAGSGKTRTLTHRIAYLIREQDVPPSRIIAVTFTNKAAREMRERLEFLVGDDARRIWMGTFHSMCAQMLRISGSHIGIDPRFVIFDADDSSRLMRELLREADLDSDRYPPGRILGRISDAKNSLKTVEEYTEAANGPQDRIVARLYARYQERLRAAHALDFDDLLVEAVRLLRASEEARNHWSERFLHVLIDEFQDVNTAQFEWAQLLARKHRNICVVGDDDQSIYAWRGADVRIILNFELTYPEAEIIRLEQNYRSTQNILDAAHGVISRNIGRKAKKLWTEDSAGAHLTVHGTANAQEEALWVVRKIEEMRRTQPYALSDFAVLCRINAQSRPFEEAFLRARIPLRLVGTQRFYERKEIKDLLAYLKVLYNPNDSVAFGRIINVPGRGIGTVTIEKLNQLAEETGKPVVEVVLDPELTATLGRAVAQKLAGVRELWLQLMKDATHCQSLADLLDKVIDHTDYIDYLMRERTVESIDRTANVEELRTATANFDEFLREEHETEATTEVLESLNMAPQLIRLGRFLETVALDNDSEARQNMADDAVTFMTLHSAKGLEFKVVFLVGMEQGLLPHARALWGENPSPDELEEERRLCYVGLTRAREQVFLSYATQRTLHGRTEVTQPSQFLEEIPNHLLQRGGYAVQGARTWQQTATDWGSENGRSTSQSTAQRLVRAATPEPATYQVGDRLRHPSFGEGLVINTSNAGGAGEWVEIAFLESGAGKKKLVVAYAPLEKV